MPGPFQRFVSDPRQPIDNSTGGSVVGDGLVAAGLAIEAAAGIKTAVDTSNAVSEIEALQQQASDGVISFQDALKQRAQALSAGDTASFQRAGDQINVLLAGEEQGKLSPMAVKVQIDNVLRQNRSNPRVTASLNRALSQSGITESPEGDVALQNLASLEADIRDVAQENNVDYATAYSFINEQAASARAVEAQKLASVRGQQNFSTYATGVRGNTSLLLDGGVSEGVEYKPITTEYLKATAGAGSDLAAVSQINNQFRAGLELRRQQALSFAAVQKDNFERQGQLMDNTDYNNMISEINTRFDGIQKVLDSSDPVTNMKAANAAVSVGGDNYRNAMFRMIGLPAYVGTDAEFQIKFLTETLPSLAGRVNAALPEEELRAMAGAGDEQASILLSMGSGRIQYMNSLVNQINGIDSISAHPTPDLMEEVTRETRSTYAKNILAGKGDAKAGADMILKSTELLAENGSDIFDTSTRRLISTNKELQKGYDNVAALSLSQYIDGLDEESVSQFGRDVKIVLRDPSKGPKNDGMLSRFFGDPGKGDYFHVETLPTERKDSPWVIGDTDRPIPGQVHHRRVLEELNNTLVNLSAYKTPKQLGEWLSQAVIGFRAKGFRVDVQDFDVDPGDIAQPSIQISDPNESE